MTDFTALRDGMIDCQLRANEVTDYNIIDVIADVERELFVPPEFKSLAYCDTAINLGNQGSDQRYLMAPMPFARMVQAAKPKLGDVALVIGCGCGYSTAVLAKLTSLVVALDNDEKLLRQAQDKLSQLQIENVVMVAGELEHGCDQAKPYDIIFIDGGVEVIPNSVFTLLKNKQGRLIAAVYENGVSKAYIYNCNDGVVHRRLLFDASVPALPGFAAEPGFVF